MPQEVARVKGWVAFAVEVEVQQVEAVPIYQHLIGVKVAVNACTRRSWQGCSYPVAGVEQPLDTLCPTRFSLGNDWQALVQDTKFVANGVAALRPHASIM
jgi:hypothetical protein